MVSTVLQVKFNGLHLFKPLVCKVVNNNYEVSHYQRIFCFKKFINMPTYLMFCTTGRLIYIHFKSF